VSNPKLRPNERTFGTILKFLADSSIPNKAKRARAIENLMKIFLESEPKEWIRKELEKCRYTEDKKGESKNGPDLRTAVDSGQDRNKPRLSARVRRSAQRFNREIEKKNLLRQPVRGEPGTEIGQEYEVGCIGNAPEAREALVRVRLVDTNTTTKESNVDTNCIFSFIVVDGITEYSCKLLNVDTAPEIKGGQFLKISYYWYRGELVVLKMLDAITGLEIPK